METIVAALIAATFAVLVAVLDRRLVAREERRRWEVSDRRQVYARFAGAVFKFAAHKSAGRDAPDLASLVDAFQELELVASSTVAAAGRDLFVEASALKKGDSPDRLIDLRREFIAIARGDLGFD